MNILPKNLLDKFDEFTAPPKDGDYDAHTMRAMCAVYNEVYSDLKESMNALEVLRRYHGGDGTITRYQIIEILRNTKIKDKYKEDL